MTKFDQKKFEIKQAGIKAFATYGFYKTTLDDIAGMLGMKKNSLYYYFESKEILIREILIDEIETHLELGRAIQKMDLTASEKLLRFAEAIINFIQERTSEYAVTLVSIIEISKVIRTLVPDFQIQQAATFQFILKEGVDFGEFRAHNTGQVAADLAELIPAFFNHNYVSSDLKFVSEIDFNRITEEIKRIIVYISDGIKAY